MIQTRSRVGSAVDCIAIGLALLGLAFAVFTFLTPITRAQVTTGSLVVVTAVVLATACLLTLIGLILVLLALMRRSPDRWRSLAAYCVGLALFVGAFVLAGSWVGHHLPPRQTSAAAIVGNLDVSA